MMEARTPIGFRSWKIGLQAGPLGIGEVGLVCFSHARYPTERVPQNPFSDDFRLEFSEVAGSSYSRTIVTGQGA
jgi:hypothetical protein